MVQKAKRNVTATDRLRESLASTSELYNIGRLQNTPVTFATSSLGIIGGSGGGSTGPAGNFIKAHGDTMVGPLAFFPKVVVMDDGQIDIGQSSGNFSSRVIITPEAGSTDTLLTITGAAFAGQIMFLQGVATDTITIKDRLSSGTAWVISTAYVLGDIVANGGNLYSCKLAHTSAAGDEPGVGASWEDKWYKANIETIDGNDFSLEDDDVIILQFDTTDNAWQQVTTGKQGIGTATLPITTEVNDLSDTWTGNQTIDLSLSTAHVTKIILDQNLTWNSPTNPPASGNNIEFEIEYIQDGTGGWTVTHWAEVVETVNISLAAGATTIVTFRTNDGGTEYHAVPSLRGSISVNATLFATKALDNLSSPVLNTNINFNSNAPTNFNGYVSQIVGNSLVNDASGATWTLPSGDAYLYNIAGAPELTVNAATIDIHDKALNSFIGWVGGVGQAVTVDGIGVTHDLPTGDQYIYSINGLDELIITSVGLAVKNSITFQDTTADPAAAGEMQRNGADMKVFTGGVVKNMTDIGSGAPPFDDNQVIIQDEVDNTKTLTFNLSLQDAAAANLLSWAAGASRTHTFSATTGILAQLNLAQSWSAIQTFEDNGIQISNPADTFQYLIQAGAIVADRTLNLPVTTGADTLAVLGLSQTFTGGVIAFTAPTSFAVTGPLITLGDAATDVLNIVADIGTDLIPDDETHDLGATGSEWNDIWITGAANLDRITNAAQITVGADFDFDAGSTIEFNISQTTVGSAGAASALPATPTGYWIVKNAAGTEVVIPFYDKT